VPRAAGHSRIALVHAANTHSKPVYPMKVLFSNPLKLGSANFPALLATTSHLSINLFCYRLRSQLYNAFFLGHTSWWSACQCVRVMPVSGRMPGVGSAARVSAPVPVQVLFQDICYDTTSQSSRHWPMV
jgi:hypothetical protein